jgi:esterase/lipase
MMKSNKRERMKKMMRTRKQLALGLTLALASISYSVAATSVLPQPGQAFTDYLVETDRYLTQNKKWIDASNSDVEKAAVMPFEIKPAANCEQTKVGVLLLHGLSDSPYSMRSMGEALAKQCLWVRAALLPGHGTRAEDLIEIERDDWRQATKVAIENFAAETNSLYVAGFSTGGALALDYAKHNKANVSGLILFSPLLKINSSIDWLSPYLAPVLTWLDHKDSDDYAKYASIPVPAIAQAYELANETRLGLEESALTLPVFIAMSAEDSTVDSAVTLDYFKRTMVDANSKLWLYSNKAVNFDDARVQEFNAYNEDLKITGLSHMSAHMDPNDPYYGKDGQYRVCSWYQDEDLKHCKQDQANWLGEKGELLAEKSPYGGRLSWNPDFNRLVDQITQFINTQQ